MFGHHTRKGKQSTLKNWVVLHQPGRQPYFTGNFRVRTTAQLLVKSASHTNPLLAHSFNCCFLSGLKYTTPLHPLCTQPRSSIFSSVARAPPCKNMRIALGIYFGSRLLLFLPLCIVFVPLWVVNNNSCRRNCEPELYCAIKISSIPIGCVTAVLASINRNCASRHPLQGRQAPSYSNSQEGPKSRENGHDRWPETLEERMCHTTAVLVFCPRALFLDDAHEREVRGEDGRSFIWVTPVTHLCHTACCWLMSYWVTDDHNGPKYMPYSRHDSRQLVQACCQLSLSTDLLASIQSSP